MSASRKPPAPVPTRHRSRGGPSAGNNQYLGDHPILVPVISLIAGGLCLWATLFSTFLQSLFLGPHPSQSDQVGFNNGTGYVIGFTIALLVVSVLYLFLTLGEMSIRQARRRKAVCPACGAVEARGAGRFAHAAEPGTAWETVTCPHCHHAWYARI